jgi:hypothetical protein
MSLVEDLDAFYFSNPAIALGGNKIDLPHLVVENEEAEVFWNVFFLQLTLISEVYYYYFLF